jgi:hypothetical protein
MDKRTNIQWYVILYYRARSFETTLAIIQTIRCHNTGGQNVNLHCSLLWFT